jgi:hypothetical protein
MNDRAPFLQRTETMSDPSFTAKCELAGTEKITKEKENARLYSLPTLPSNGVCDNARKPQGDADAD